MRMDITQFMNEYAEFRKDHPFQENPDEEFITLEGRTNVESEGLKWSDVTSKMFEDNTARYGFLDGKKNLWLFKNVGASKETGATIGIVLQWDLKRVIKELTYNSSTDTLTLTVSTSAYFWRFSSTDQKSSRERFSDYTGNIDEPVPAVPGDPDPNMDTQSPVHPPTGIVDMSGPFN